MNREGLACSAGFFNGEGHVGSSVGTSKCGTPRRDLYLTISQTDRWVLDEFRDSVGGLGRVTGPFVRSYRNPREHDVYYYQLNRFEHVQAVVAMLWPWLSPIKRAQAGAALTSMRARTSHRQTYPCGHARSPQNTYDTDGSRRCRQCRLDQQKHLRRVRKTALAMLAA